MGGLPDSVQCRGTVLRTSSTRWTVTMTECSPGPSLTSRNLMRPAEPCEHHWPLLSGLGWCHPLPCLYHQYLSKFPPLCQLTISSAGWTVTTMAFLASQSLMRRNSELHSGPCTGHQAVASTSVQRIPHR